MVLVTSGEFIQNTDAGELPLWFSGLRIWCCHSCGMGRRYGSYSDLIWELPYAMGVAKKKKKIYRDTRAPPLQIHIQLLKSKAQGVLIVGHWKWILVVSMRMQVRSLALLSGSVILHCHELWCRSKTRLMSVLPWLWLWLWPASEAPIQSLAWEFPYTTGEALKDKKKKKKRERERENKTWASVI